MKRRVRKLLDNHAVYVTRPDGRKLVTTYRVSYPLTYLTSRVAIANVLGWGAYGLYELALKVT